MTEKQTPTSTRGPRRIAQRAGGARIGGALIRYRIMAIVTGTALLLLVFVAIPIQIWGHNDGPVSVIGTTHGFLFMVYLVTGLDLGIRVRWPLWRLGLVLIAGTVPFLSFVMERSVTHELAPRVASD
jgi:integral membrane protein